MGFWRLLDGYASDANFFISYLFLKDLHYSSDRHIRGNLRDHFGEIVGFDYVHFV